MRVLSAYTTARKMMMVVMKALMGFGCCRKICSKPPPRTSSGVLRELSRYTVLGRRPPGGFAVVSACPGVLGTQLKSPVKMDWLTPAAMKRLIPLPTPHLLMTSSMRKMRYAPRESWNTRMPRAPQRPVMSMRPWLGVRKPNTWGMAVTKIMRMTMIFWVPW